MNKMHAVIHRRALLASFASLATLTAAGCASLSPRAQLAAPPPPPPIPDEVLTAYAALPDEQFPVPAVDLSELDPRYFRRIVGYATPEAPGTIVVDTAERYLYHVQENGAAMRYGIGIGRAGFEWSGRAHIAYKREWPVWTPTATMIQREPELAKWRGGHPPGIENPLGARALYVHQGNRDTLYRIHGTGEAWSIGKAVSSGCVRLLHQDVIHLYERVRPGSAMVVLA